MFSSHIKCTLKTKTISDETKHSREQAPKRRTPVRGIQPSSFAYVFDGGPDSKVCLHGAIRIGLSLPSTRGNKRQNAEPPCAGSNQVSSHTFLTGVLTARSAFVVRPASGYRGNWNRPAEIIRSK